MNKAWLGVKNKLPSIWKGTKTVCSYVWDTYQIGVAQGQALTMSINTSLNLPANTTSYWFVGSHAVLTFAKKLWKNSNNLALKKVSGALKEFLVTTRFVPLLGAVAAGLVTLDPTTSLVVFVTSIALSVTHRAIKKLKKNQEKKHADKNKCHNATQITSDFLLTPLFKVLSRGGEGAFLKLEIEFLIEVLADMEIIDSAAAATNPWLMAVIIIPMALELVRYSLELKNKNKNGCEVGYDVSVESSGELMGSLGFNTELWTQLIAIWSDSNNLATVTDPQALTIMGSALGVSIISGIKKAVDVIRKLRKKASEHQEVGNQLDIEHGIEMLELRPSSTASILTVMPSSQSEEHTVPTTLSHNQNNKHKKSLFVRWKERGFSDALSERLLEQPAANSTTQHGLRV